MYDVVIVGASIAGAGTAIHLANAGVKVALIDRATFPRRKVCGEGLFPLGRQHLEALNVPGIMPPHSADLMRLRLTLGSHSAEGNLSPKGHRGLGINRSTLDAALVEKAASVGVEVVLGVTVTGLETNRTGSFEAALAEGHRFPGRVVVAADGLRSRLRNQNGLDAKKSSRRYGVAAHAHVPAAAGDRVDVYVGRGYEAYITPVGPSEVNLALLLDGDTANSFGGALRERFCDLLASVLPEYTYSLIEEPRLTGPFPAGSRRQWQRNLLLVGDASGFFDGITGEGMSLALRSAPLAAGAIQRYLASGSEQGFATFEKQVKKMRRPSTMLARLLLTARHSPALSARMLDNMGRHPGTFSRLAGFSDGELGLSEIRPRDLLALILGI